MITYETDDSFRIRPYIGPFEEIPQGITGRRNFTRERDLDDLLSGLYRWLREKLL